MPFSERPKHPVAPKKRIVFATPSYSMVGGTVKIIDYVGHAQRAGLATAMSSRASFLGTKFLSSGARIKNILDGVGEFIDPEVLKLTSSDLFFFSLPTDLAFVKSAILSGFPLDQIIHLIQNTRHALAAFQDGYALRLLGRPLHRISINEVVARATSPYRNDRHGHCVIPLGHDVSFFQHPRDAPPAAPLTVGYTTWKSEVGLAVEQALQSDRRFAFVSVRTQVDWLALKEFYAKIDVFLCTPLEQEGFYLPGLEAMAAGCIVITPDAGGNMTYCRPNENCLLVEYGKSSDYVRALGAVAAMGDRELVAMRSAGHATLEGNSLEREGRQFADYLAKAFDYHQAA